MSDDEPDRGPNGFPYIDADRTDFGKWESGEYRLRVGREDGEVLNTNLRPKEYRAFVHALLHTLERDGDEIATVAAGPKVEQVTGDVAYTLRVNDVAGFPGTIVNDLQRVDEPEAERVYAAHWYNHEAETSVVVIEALDDNAMKWFYDWLEDSKQYYKEEYVDAGGEYKAAEELATAVYDVMSEA
jgi:hypothetical protein